MGLRHARLIGRTSGCQLDSALNGIFPNGTLERSHFSALMQPGDLGCDTLTASAGPRARGMEHAVDLSVTVTSADQTAVTSHTYGAVSPW
ncbi:hypothetical protein AAFF_G00217830 [Aldrovandia affinis]|uniref:Uncharacterized protein n=1 Tax=Aldrovandia affinis TaxID=143900 RepID=A0AAD7WVD0_9TELE|nr:hypothetical protein AAFF_G00217830 [Aldrovandia affinis]